ncbi:MAG: patatin-like phospholipase family protein, partial [Candidatus Eremiobacterota bacterium]
MSQVALGATGGSVVSSPPPPAPAMPADTFVPSEAGRSLPGRIWEGVGKLGSKLASAARTTAVAAPTVGTLVAAWAASRVEGLIPGQPDLSAIEWLRLRMPNVYAWNVEKLLELGGPPVEHSAGISLNELGEIDKHLYKMLSPELTLDGKKAPPTFLERLAEATFQAPQAPRAAYVYLGEQRNAEAHEIMELWRSSNPQPPNPFQPDDDRHYVWSVLEQKVAEGKMPVFMDLDDQVHTFDSSEFLARETIASMVERGSPHGGQHTEAGFFYTWLVTRLHSYYETLDPWLAKHNAGLHSQVESVKQNLTPPWLGGAQGVGPFPSPPRVQEALGTMKDLTMGPPEELADAAVALDRDLLSGIQSHWIKLLREVGSEGRELLLGPVARTWVKLNVLGEPDQVSPPGAPVLVALEGPPPVSTRRPYDRALAMGEVVDHSIRGLGIKERREFISDIRLAVSHVKPQLWQRELGLRNQLGARYSGIDLDNLSQAGPALNQLKELWRAQSLDPRLLATVGHHLELLDWLANCDTRYGDVNPGVVENSAEFSQHPFGISEYFWQQPPQSVTPLGPGPTQVEWLGQGSDIEGKRLSILMEGGGGKGFAYVESIRQLRQILENSPGRFGIDEFVGTSAGAITAGILAAGYTVDEVGDILKRLDFKEFNSDAVWLMGGVDPKVRGTNRTGLFSQQKMYQVFTQLLSEKLGIEGRPVLFRDLPFKLTVVTDVLNTDMPKDDPLHSLIDGDGRMVLSSDTT